MLRLALIVLALVGCSKAPDSETPDRYYGAMSSVIDSDIRSLDVALSGLERDYPQGMLVSGDCERLWFVWYSNVGGPMARVEREHSNAVGFGAYESSYAHHFRRQATEIDRLKTRAYELMQ